MAEPIIYVVICMIVSMIFVILGIYQYRAKDPVTINTGETPPKAEDLIASPRNQLHHFQTNDAILAKAWNKSFSDLSDMFKNI